MVSVTGLHRKSLIRLMKGDLHCALGNGALFTDRKFSPSSGRIVCAERLTPLMAQHLEACGLDPGTAGTIGTDQPFDRGAPTEDAAPRATSPPGAFRPSLDPGYPEMPWDLSVPGCLEADRGRHFARPSRARPDRSSLAAPGDLCPGGKPAGGMVFPTLEAAFPGHRSMTRCALYCYCLRSNRCLDRFFPAGADANCRRRR